MTGCIFSESNKIQAISAGGFADVYLAYLAHGKGHKPVAVKRLRIHINQGFVKVHIYLHLCNPGPWLLTEYCCSKTLIWELGIWSKLDHPYILSFLGYSFDDDNYYPMLVSEWMANGTIKDYIARHEDCDLSVMVDQLFVGFPV